MEVRKSVDNQNISSNQVLSQETVNAGSEIRRVLLQSAKLTSMICLCIFPLLGGIFDVHVDIPVHRYLSLRTFCEHSFCNPFVPLNYENSSEM